jgi:hypothetical protein
MHLKIQAEQRGAHIHVTFWMAPAEGQTHAHCGTLVMRPDEWEWMRRTHFAINTPISEKREKF